MRRRSTHPLTTVLCMVLSLLFSQLALAGYACPAQADAHAMARMAVSGRACDGRDPAQPVLCHQHAAATTPSLDAAKPPVATAPLIVQMVVLPTVVHALVDAVAVSDAALPEVRPPPDPVFLSTRRLRV